jgi:hypothetical protein
VHQQMAVCDKTDFGFKESSSPSTSNNVESPKIKRERSPNSNVTIYSNKKNA